MPGMAASVTHSAGMLLLFGLICLFFGTLGGFAWRQKGGHFWVGFLTGFILTWLGWVILIVAKPRQHSSESIG